MNLRYLAALAIFLLATACTEGDRDFFAASEKVAMPVTGTWTKVSGQLGSMSEQHRIGDPIVVEKVGATSYTAEGRGTAKMSFVRLEGTNHTIVVVERDPDRVVYYLMRRTGNDIFLIDMDCPAGRIPGVEKGEYVCKVSSREALLALAYNHLSNPQNLGPDAPGALYRRVSP